MFSRRIHINEMYCLLSRLHINITQGLLGAVMYYFFVVTTLVHLGMTTWVPCTNYEAKPSLRMRHSFGDFSELQLVSMVCIQRINSAVSPRDF